MRIVWENIIKKLSCIDLYKKFKFFSKERKVLFVNVKFSIYIKFFNSDEFYRNFYTNIFEWNFFLINLL